MIEILIMGNVAKDFNRLGIELRETYNGVNYKVCEVTKEEFETLCDEPDIEGIWDEGCWRYCKGSNQDKPNRKVVINGKEIIAWYDDEIPLKEFRGLVHYLCEEMGVSQPRNVCALSTDLAKHNNMKLSELFKIYEGN